MERVVILHGRPSRDEYLDSTQPSASNAHWLPWLQNELLINGFDAQTPEMLKSYEPDYAIWEAEFERNLSDGPMSFVGHSTGGGFLVRWLSKKPAITPRIVVLVAPWLDPESELNSAFFKFEIDKTLAQRTKLVIFDSTSDYQDVRDSVVKIRHSIPNLEYREFTNYGHFCLSDMGGPEFPELLEAVIDKKP